ncbi:MAG: EscU/YscU/HrcU family type III secretion system export apparatus switch protein [Candidatus Eremiobacterota bacterium]
MSRAEGEWGRWAVALRLGQDGRPRVVAAGQGAVADEIVARAEAAGVEVRHDPETVHELLQAEGEGTRIDPEIYELMTTVINFAQELNDAWIQPGVEQN